MHGILTDLAEALRMAADLPLVASIPLFGIGYCILGYCIVSLIARIRRLIKEW